MCVLQIPHVCVSKHQLFSLMQANTGGLLSTCTRVPKMLTSSPKNFANRILFWVFFWSKPDIK